jgi:uncharacterized membrane protein HdeD (DUF308 family)
MTVTAVERRRTGADVVIGVLLVLGGLYILGNAVVATVLSVLLIGWSALIAGVVELVGAVGRIRSGGFWSTALGGVVLAVLGLFILRNPVVGAVSLTLLAGSLFLAIGLTRIAVGFQVPRGRWMLVVSGVISVLLGLSVLLNLVAASLTLLGVLLGVQVVLEGVERLTIGRVRPVAADDRAPADSAADPSSSR